MSTAPKPIPKAILLPSRGRDGRGEKSRRKKSRREKPSGLMSPVAMAAIGGGVLIVLVIGGVGAYFGLSGHGKKDSGSVTSTSASSRDVSRGSPGNDNSGGAVKNGTGNESPLAFLPADHNVYVGVRVADLHKSGLVNGTSMLNGPMKQTGLDEKDIDQVIVSIKLPSTGLGAAHRADMAASGAVRQFSGPGAAPGGARGGVPPGIIGSILGTIPGGASGVAGAPPGGGAQGMPGGRPGGALGAQGLPPGGAPGAQGLPPGGAPGAQGLPPGGAVGNRGGAQGVPGVQIGGVPGQIGGVPGQIGGIPGQIGGVPIGNFGIPAGPGLQLGGVPGQIGVIPGGGPGNPYNPPPRIIGSISGTLPGGVPGPQQPPPVGGTPGPSGTPPSNDTGGSTDLGFVLAFLRSGLDSLPANAEFVVVAHFTTPIDPEKLAESTAASRSTGKNLFRFTDRQSNRPAYFFAPNSNLLVLGRMPEAQVQALANSNGVPSERQQALVGDSSSLVWAIMPPGPGNAPLLRAAGARLSPKATVFNKLEGLSLQMTMNGDNAVCNLQFQFPDSQSTASSMQELSAILSSLGKPVSSPAAGKDKDADRTRSILANLKVIDTNGNHVIVEGTLSRADLLAWIAGDAAGPAGIDAVPGG